MDYVYWLLTLLLLALLKFRYKKNVQCTYLTKNFPASKLFNTYFLTHLRETYSVVRFFCEANGKQYNRNFSSVFAIYSIQPFPGCVNKWRQYGFTSALNVALNRSCCCCISRSFVNRRRWPLSGAEISHKSRLVFLWLVLSDMCCVRPNKNLSEFLIASTCNGWYIYRWNVHRKDFFCFHTSKF